MAQPSKMNAEVTASFVAALESGSGMLDACKAAGITHTTFYAWERRGRAGMEPFVSFVKACDAARTAYENRRIAELREPLLRQFARAS